MDSILTWLSENWGITLTGSTVLTVLALFARWFTKTKIPELFNKITEVFGKVVSNLFGSNLGTTPPLVEALPFLNKFEQKFLALEDRIESKVNETAETTLYDIELRLVDLKSKLSSPVYTALEKIPMQAVYDEIMAGIKQKLPKSILDALEALDKIATNQ